MTADTLARGPIRSLAGDRQSDWPESIFGARCPDCGRFVGSLIVHFRPDPLGFGDVQIEFVAGICQTHGRIIATGWIPWP